MAMATGNRYSRLDHHQSSSMFSSLITSSHFIFLQHFYSTIHKPHPQVPFFGFECLTVLTESIGNEKININIYPTNDKILLIDQSQL